jgi:hypothetical protein
VNNNNTREGEVNTWCGVATTQGEEWQTTMQGKEQATTTQGWVTWILGVE